MKQFRCGDLVPGCNATFTGSRDEILTAVARHAVQDHGMPEFGPELVVGVESRLVTVG